MSVQSESVAKPVLVLGATGKTGRRVLARLSGAGVPVRAGSRGSDPAFDWNDAESWGRALDGVGSIYLAYAPDVAIPGAEATVEAFIRTALSRGVSRIVMLSGRGEPEAEVCEDILKTSGARWTILRCSWFAQNFSESFMLDGVLAGELALPVNDMTEPFVDCDDIADVAVAALTGEGHEGKLYALTGPRSLSFAEAVAEISEPLGRPVRFTRVPLGDYAAAMRADGAPDDIVDLTTHLFGTLFDGRNAATEDGVMQALGRPAKDFRDYAREAAASGVWDRPAEAQAER